MSDREQYTPGPANIARVQKDPGQGAGSLDEVDQS
jgi:hypothetical protein